MASKWDRWCSETAVTWFICVAALVLLMQAVCKRWFPYILKVPSWYMYSALLVICLASAYVDSGNLYKCGMMMVFAAVGILMTLGQLPASPLILAFILTPTLETKTLQAFQSVPKWTRFRCADGDRHSVYLFSDHQAPFRKAEKEIITTGAAGATRPRLQSII